MKLRISNNYSYAIEFEANDLNSFRQQGLSALRQFRIATERRVHRGEIHKTVSQFTSGSIQWQYETTWYNPGFQKVFYGEGPLNGAIYFNPVEISVPFIEADGWQTAANQDEIWFTANLERNWNFFAEAYQYMLQLTSFLHGALDDMIDKAENDHE